MAQYNQTEILSPVMLLDSSPSTAKTGIKKKVRLNIWWEIVSRE